MAGYVQLLEAVVRVGWWVTLALKEEEDEAGRGKDADDAVGKLCC